MPTLPWYTKLLICFCMGWFVEGNRSGYQMHIDRTLITLAATRGSVDHFLILLERGANVNTENGKALVNAVHDENTKIARLLLANGADVHAQNEKGQTLIQLTVERGNVELVELLLRYGARLNDNLKANPLIRELVKQQFYAHNYASLDAAGQSPDSPFYDLPRELIGYIGAKNMWTAEDKEKTERARQQVAQRRQQAERARR